jgi:hypothetical protein
MAPFHEFAKDLDVAITWYREHINLNDPTNSLKMVFGTCQSSRDIVIRLKRFMEKDPKKYSGIKHEILNMKTFIDEHEHTFDEFEQDKKVFDQLIVAFKAKLNGKPVSQSAAAVQKVNAIIISDDDSDGDSAAGAGRAMHGAGFLFVVYENELALYVPPAPPAIPLSAGGGPA